MFVVYVVAAGIDGDSGREIFDFQAGDRFRAQVCESDRLHALHAFAQQRAGAADGDQIKGVIAYAGFADRRGAVAFADGDADTQVIQARGLGIHAHAGGRAGTAIDMA